MMIENINKIPFIFFTGKHYNYYFVSYYVVLFYLIISLMLGSLIFLLSYMLIKKNSYVEKLIPYECGFEPYEDSRNIFNVQFYLVALLFLIFDLESLFLYPLVMGLPFLNNFSFYILLDFFFEIFLSYLIIYKYILKKII